MKNIALLLVLLFSVFCWAQQKHNPDDYPITVHVSSAQFEWGQSRIQRLHVVINMKKYELVDFQVGGELLALGDYKARLIENPRRRKTAYESNQSYEFLFPDQRTRKFLVAGQSE